MAPRNNSDRQQVNSFPPSITWRTAAPVALDCGQLRGAGNAMPQVRSFQLLAAVGDLNAQINHVQAAITGALEQVLTGMQPSRAQLANLRDEIASATLVAANSRLGADGVVLLDLNIDTLSPLS